MSIDIHYEHPAEFELLAYAEGLVGQRADLDPATAQHVRSCGHCRDVVDEMKASMFLLEEAGNVEPSRELAASIEMASQKLRREIRTKQAIGEMWIQGKRLAVAAAVLLMAGVLLNIDPADPAMAPQAQGVTQAPMKAEIFSIETLTSLTPEEEILGSAVVSAFRQPQTVWEQTKLRELQAYEDDITEAMQALRNNPALVRAGQLIHHNRQLKGQTLKDVYVERD